jgi:GH24 family phage-related lysozyme (muramidase)
MTTELSGFLSAATFEAFDKKIAEATAAYSALSKGAGDIPGLTGKNVTDKNLINNLANGISPSQADEMLAKDLANNETSIKKTLSSVGVTKIPQNVFDGLVSFQNQVGDISYAYVGGSKVDLTSFYKNGEWDNAASFIAAD